MGLRVYESEKERREVRKWRRKELEEYRDWYNAYYFGYANLPTCKEARHLRYMENRDRILAYMKRYYQMKKKKDYFMKKGFLNKHVKVHKSLE